MFCFVFFYENEDRLIFLETKVFDCEVGHKIGWSDVSKWNTHACKIPLWCAGGRQPHISAKYSKTFVLTNALISSKKMKCCLWIKRLVAKRRMNVHSRMRANKMSSVLRTIWEHCYMKNNNCKRGKKKTGCPSLQVCVIGRNIVWPHILYMRCTLCTCWATCWEQGVAQLCARVCVAPLNPDHVWLNVVLQCWLSAALSLAEKFWEACTATNVHIHCAARLHKPQAIRSLTGLLSVWFKPHLHVCCTTLHCSAYLAFQKERWITNCII